MKTNQTKILFLAVLTAIALAAGKSMLAQTPAKSNDAPKAAAAVPQKPLPADPEERFKFLFTKAVLAGRSAPLNDGVLGEQREGDKYNIVSATKGDGDNWTINAKMNYHGQDMVIPVPAKVKFAGDTAVLVVDNFTVMPGGTAYSARLLIYERTYSGTWKGGRGGGMLYGTISNAAE